MQFNYKRSRVRLALRSAWGVNLLQQAGKQLVVLALLLALLLGCLVLLVRPAVEGQQG
jgi:hypothetical protein